jgi:hypothetical protein
MKIDKVIFTIDDNPHYKGFWSSISRHYKERLKMEPVLYIIGDKTITNINSYDKTYGEVRFIEKVTNVPTIIQALIGKFYFTIFEPETTWLIGDLDLYPLQKFHFIDRLVPVDDQKYVHLNPFAYGVDWRNSYKGLAGYFHAAKGKIFSSELKFDNKTFADVCNEIYNSTKYGIKFYGLPAGKESKSASSDWGWFCCEEMYTGELLSKSSNLVELNPVNNKYLRVDRSTMSYDVDNLSNGVYIDFHAPRPYESHQEIIEFIISKIPH